MIVFTGNVWATYDFNAASEKSHTLHRRYRPVRLNAATQMSNQEAKERHLHDKHVELHTLM